MTPSGVNRWKSAAAPGVSFNQLQPAFRAEEIGGRLHRVGGRTVGRDDGHGRAVLVPHPGRRVDDVRIAMAVDLDEPLGVAGRRDRRVLQEQGGRAVFQPGIHWGNRDPPALGIGGRVADDDVAGAADQGATDPLGFQDVERRLRRVALGDPADVQLHPGMEELDGPRGRVEDHLVGADELLGLGDQPGIRQLPVATRPAPEPAHRGDRDVEGAAGAFVHPLRPLEDVEQVGADPHRALSGLPREPGELALGIVIAQHGVERRDPIEGRPGGASGGGCVVGV